MRLSKIILMSMAIGVCLAPPARAADLALKAIGNSFTSACTMASVPAAVPALSTARW